MGLLIKEIRMRRRPWFSKRLDIKSVKKMNSRRKRAAQRVEPIFKVDISQLSTQKQTKKNVPNTKKVEISESLKKKPSKTISKKREKKSRNLKC